MAPTDTFRQPENALGDRAAADGDLAAELSELSLPLGEGDPTPGGAEIRLAQAQLGGWARRVVPRPPGGHGVTPDGPDAAGRSTGSAPGSPRAAFWRWSLGSLSVTPGFGRCEASR